jgi:O-antigen/teichoic acid export membrane protein
MFATRKIFDESLATIGFQIVSYIAGFLLIPIIVKTSGEETYGYYVIFISLIGIVSASSPLGADFALRRFMPSLDNKTDRARIFYPQFYFNMISAIFLAFIVFSFYPIVEKTFLDSTLDFTPWLVAPFLVLLTIYSQCVSIFRYADRILFFNFITMIYPYILLALILIGEMLIGAASISSLVISQILALILVILCALKPAIKLVGFGLIWYKQHDFIRDLKFGLPLIAVVLFEQVISVSDRYVIAAYLDVKSVAHYAIAYAVGSIPMLYVKALGIVAPPILARLKDQGKEKEIGEKIDMIISIYLMVVFPFTLGTIILGEPLLALYVGQDTGAAAAGLLPIISGAVFFYGASSFLFMILFVELKTSAIFFAQIVAGSVNVVANILLIYLYRDIYVAAWTTLASYFLTLVIALQFVDKAYRPVLIGPKAVKTAFSALAMFLFIYLLKFIGLDFYTMGGLLIAIITGGIVYLLLLWVTQAISYKELISNFGSAK